MATSLLGGLIVFTQLVVLSQDYAGEGSVVTTHLVVECVGHSPMEEYRLPVGEEG